MLLAIQKAVLKKKIVHKRFQTFFFHYNYIDFKMFHIVNQSFVQCKAANRKNTFFLQLKWISFKTKQKGEKKIEDLLL